MRKTTEERNDECAKERNALESITPMMKIKEKKKKKNERREKEKKKKEEEKKRK